MASSADDLIDRRLMRRKLTFWRGLALVIAALGIVAVGILASGQYGAGFTNQIARIPVNGTILHNRDLIARIGEAADNDAVKAIIIAVDSPGGTTVGGESLHEAIIKAKASKPVVAEVATMAASAGYMIASAADHIVARESSIVGSIGVLVQMPNVSTLINRLGISVDEVKSSPMKAEPSALNLTTTEELAMIERMVRDSYDWFVDLVAENRKLSRAEVLAVADGAVFTGRQAKDRKLVDSLGGEDAVLAYLKTRNIDDTLEIIDWSPSSQEPLGLFRVAGQAFAQSLGISLPDWQGAMRATGLGSVFLDGLVSVWQGSGRNSTGGSASFEGN
ncbi:MAG: signal peptide peptidase SppA [Phyllobacteriaceae bacterium]|nr:signal peptide peptidase SppA [Phyllobacteriaceae bacterium]